MDEVVRRLKKIIPQSIYQQQDDGDISASEDPVLISIEASSHGELSQLIKNFHNVNTNEIEFATSTNEQTTSKNISSEKNLSKVVSEIVAFISKTNNEVELSNQKIIYYFYDHNIIQKKF
jgi:UTP-glucose-1-phosphate uridylyltransferase